VVEHLPSKHKALISNVSTEKYERKTQNTRSWKYPPLLHLRKWIYNPRSPVFPFFLLGLWKLLHKICYFFGLCEKYAHVSKVKEWAQRHVEYSESKIFTVVLQDREPGGQTPKSVTTNTGFSSVLPLFPCWLRTMWFTFFPYIRYISCWVILTHAPLGFGQSLEGDISGFHIHLWGKVSLWYVLSDTHSFHPFPHFIPHPLFKFFVSWPSPNWYANNRAGLNALPWKQSKTGFVFNTSNRAPGEEP
jgi:hypothetical protein